MSDSSTELFSKNWDTYQKIIHANYMLHKEFGFITKQALMDASINRSISFLDLGCGDASHLAYHLNGLKLDSYTGFDMSSYALELAKKNIPQISKSMIFQEGNMVVLLEKNMALYSVIYSSYAIHHLDSNLKAKLLQDIYQQLLPGGIFIYIDIYKQEEQSRDQYISNYRDWMFNHWSLIEKDAKELVYEHLSQFDFPEELSFYTQHLSEIGFALVHLYQEDPRHFLLICKK